MCSRTPSERASTADSRSRSAVTENGEQGAMATRTIDENDGSWYRSTASAMPRRGVGGLHREVGRKAALRGSEVHRPARRVQPHADARGRLDDRADDVAGALREDVVVVGDGRAPRARQHRHRAGARCPSGGRRSATRAGRARQPVEQDGVLGISAGEPLVEVVVGVDEPRGDQASRAVEELGVLRATRRSGPAPTPRCRPSSSTTWPSGCSVPGARRSRRARPR